MRRDRGMVTAELATIAPFAVALGFLLLWVVSLGVTQVRLADASRESARLIARGEPTDSAAEIAREHAPSGATVEVSSDGGAVSVTVRVRSRVPVPLFSHIGSRELQSTSVAAKE